MLSCKAHNTHLRCVHVFNVLITINLIAFRKSLFNRFSIETYIDFNFMHSL